MRYAALVVAICLMACDSPTNNGNNDHPLIPSQTRIAISALHGPIRLSTLSGAAEKILITGNVNAQDWSPGGDRLVYVDDRGNGNYALSVTDTLGNSHQLPVPLSSTWPHYAATGDWIYFFTQADNPPGVYRIHSDGTGMQQIMTGKFPAPAPDGQRLAIVSSAGIWVGNIASGTGNVVANTPGAIALRWSPDGDWLAYRVLTKVYVMRPDGSATKMYASEFPGGLSWSPDSRWLISGSENSTLQLIDTRADTTTLMPVAGLYPAWKPK